MRSISLLLLAVSLTFAANARAALVSVKASADMTSGLSLATDLLPVGTTVDADLLLDIGAGTHRTATFRSVSGSFSWVDASLGGQVFTATDVNISTRSSQGWIVLRFTGSSPTIDGITADNFSMQFDIGTNPFTPPGSTAELFDLVLNSSVISLRVAAQSGLSVQSGTLETNVSASINAVPLPGAALLFASGLMLLFASGLRRGRAKLWLRPASA